MDYNHYENNNQENRTQDGGNQNEMKNQASGQGTGGQNPNMNNYGNPYRQPESANPYRANDNRQSNYQTAYGNRSYNNANYQNQGGMNGMNGNGNYRNAYPGGQRPAKKKAKGGMGAFIAKCAAGAAVFGLVASLVFTGVSAGLGALTGSSSKESAGEESKIVTNVSNTSTGSAKDMNDVSAIANEVMPSIVAITNVGTVTYQSLFGSQKAESESAGSGIIIKQDKNLLYIVTNNHVVANSKKLTVQFADGTTAAAEITGTDPSDDLAVIQIKMDGIKEDTQKNIKVAAVGDSKAMTVGQATIAIGNALGYGQSVTTGVISAKGRTVSTQDETTGQVITNTNLIQTDAAINPGNSGGALLNAKGEVIGINSVKYASTGVEGIGYAIPMEDAVGIIEALISGDKLPQNAFLGVSGQAVSNDVASKFNIPAGVYVSEVIKNSAAESAGVKKGDIITEIGGTKVTSMADLKAVIAGHKEGDKVAVKVSRMTDGGYKSQEIEVTLGATSEDDSASNRQDSQNGRRGQQGQQDEQEQQGLQPGGDGSGLEDFFGNFFGN